MTEETKQCPECGKLMIKVGTGLMLLSIPPIYPQEWECGCGHTEEAESIRGEYEHDRFMRRWNEANSTE